MNRDYDNACNATVGARPNDLGAINCGDSDPLFIIVIIVIAIVGMFWVKPWSR
jgi:hypothetical protein